MQTWKNKHIPERWMASSESVKREMPSWDYTLVTDEMGRAMVKQHFPDFLPTYDAFPHNIQRADALRYVWLYLHGGVYMDLDIVITKSLQPLLSGECEVYLVHSGNASSYYTNALMAGKPGSSFWLECIEEMKQPPASWWLGKHWLVMNTTGPMMLSRVAQRTGITIGVLPTSLLIPCSLCDLPCKYSPESYAFAIEGSSWIGADTVCYNFFFCNWRLALVIAIVLIIALVLLLWR